MTAPLCIKPQLTLSHSPSPKFPLSLNPTKMEPQPPPPSSAPSAAATSPKPPIAPPKIRLMCSYGGHIVPRPHDKSLYYAGGETRLVAVDRRTTAASLAALTAQLSRTLFGNRPFLLKYQLPDEDLDSLISVITDEDLANMIEENDRINPPARIRLFLFAVKPESVGSALLGPKSESWLSDALNSTGILQKGQSADCGLLLGMAPDLDVHVESGSNSGGGGGGCGSGGETKLVAESLVLETSSSFGSTSSSFSMSNSPPIAILNCNDKGLSLLDWKNRIPSSASFESDNTVVSLTALPKTGVTQEPLIQVGLEESSENPIFDPSFDIRAQKTFQVLGYPLSHFGDGKKQYHDTPLIQGGLQYMLQYAGPVPMSPYYPAYQMPIHAEHVSCPPNQPYPVYLVPVRPTQYHNIPMPCSSIDANTATSSRPPLPPQTSVTTQPVGHKEVFGDQIAESATTVYCSSPASTQLVIPSNQGQVEHQDTLEPVKPTAAVSAIEGSEFDEDIAYNQIYKTQPSLPVLPSHYQTMKKGTTMLSEPSVLAK